MLVEQVNRFMPVQKMGEFPFPNHNCWEREQDRMKSRIVTKLTAVRAQTIENARHQASGNRSRLFRAKAAPSLNPQKRKQ